ncbi:DUF3501 family protein [Myxococcota bacterium]|nr:DUF3501 family protein [Myxococcota bacterium]
MAKSITSTELYAPETYELLRLGLRHEILTQRKLRRVELSPRVRLIFTSRESVLYDLHETIRDEGLTDPLLLQAEIDVHNEFLPTSTALHAELAVDTNNSSNPRQELENLSHLGPSLTIEIAETLLHAVIEEPVPQGAPQPARQRLRFELSKGERKLCCDLQKSVIVKLEHPKCKTTAPLNEKTRRILAEDLQ